MHCSQACRSTEYRLLCLLEHLPLLPQRRPLSVKVDQPKLVGQRGRIRGNRGINFVREGVMFLANLFGMPFSVAAGLDQVLCRIIHLVFIGFQLRFDFFEPVA